MTNVKFVIPRNEVSTNHQKCYEKIDGNKFGTIKTGNKEFIILSFGHEFVVVPSTWLIHQNQ